MKIKSVYYLWNKHYFFDKMLSFQYSLFIFICITIICICLSNSVPNAPNTGHVPETTENNKDKNTGVIEDNSVPRTVINWFRDYNDEALNIFQDTAKAEWGFYTSITEENRQILIQKRLEKAAFQRSSARKALDYLNYRALLDDKTKYQLDRITDIGISAINRREKFVRNILLEAEEEEYSSSKICIHEQCIDTIPDAYTRISTTEDVSQKKDIWIKIYDSYKDMRPLFAERLALTNEAFKALGYKDTADYWDTAYPPLLLSKTTDKIWEEIRPLYQLLHTYVRYRLKIFYDDESLFPGSGHIPEHLTGSPGSSDWLGVYDKVKPFDGVADINITQELHRKVNNVDQMARKVNDIFSTLGLNISEASGRNDFLLSKPKETNVSCVPSVMNMYDKQIRMQLCAEVDQRNFLSLFGMFGTAVYMSSYSEQPVPFQSETFPDLGSAIGGTVSLSGLSPTNLKQFDLVESVSEGYKSDVNYLFWMALRILPRLAHDYATGQWKVAVYSRWVNETDYNRHWWQLRCRYEGIIPPDKRSESNFDMGVHTEAWQTVPFFRSFLGTILQFQLHDSLCYETGHMGALHKCNLLNKDHVGQKLKSMMSLGSSYPWTTVLGDDDLRAQPLLSYFSPLKIWLRGELSHIEDLEPTHLETISKSCSKEISSGQSAPSRLPVTFHFIQHIVTFLIIVIMSPGVL